MSAKSEPLGSVGRLSAPTKAFYGLGAVAFGVKDNGFSFLLLLFYNQVVGLPAATVGLAIMLALVVDSVLDPIMGQISDRTRSRLGRRHPYMYAAAIPVAASYLLLWNPPDWSQGALFFYLLGATILIRSFITMYEVPSSALSAELTRDYDERTRVLSWRAFFGWWGGLSMTLLAFQVLLKPDAQHAVGQLNPEGYARYGLIASAIMFVAILVSAVGTQRHVPRQPQPPPPERSLGGLAREMVETLSHRSLLALMAAGVCNAMATGLSLSLNLYFTTYLWRLSATQIAIFTLGNFAAAAFAFLLAAPLSKRLGKRTAAQCAKALAFVGIASPIALRLLDVFPPDGHPALIPLLLLASVLAVTFAIISGILIASMIADVAEDSELRTQRRSEGLFFAASTLVAKATSGVGIFASGLILLAVGFPQGAAPGAVDPEVVRALGVTFLCILLAIYAAAISLIGLYKISRSSHAEALDRLARQGPPPEPQRRGGA